jgi:hypothetical protein
MGLKQGQLEEKISIWSFRGSDHKEGYILECDAV